MKSQKDLIKNFLGEKFISSLQKEEMASGIYKPSANVSIEIDDIYTSLKIVPKFVLEWVYENIKYMKKGDNRDLSIPSCWTDGVEHNLHIDKHDHDVFSGEITANGDKITSFKYRSLPAIGLILLSTFELYDIEKLDEKKDLKHIPQHSSSDIDRSILNALKLKMAIQSVLDGEKEEKEAINDVINSRIPDIFAGTMQKSKKTKKPTAVREFVSKIKNKTSVVLDKSIKCPHCNTELYKSGDKSITLCICYGEFMNKTLKLTKSESSNASLDIPKGFGGFNLEMLLEAIKMNK